MTFKINLPLAGLRRNSLSKYAYILLSTISIIFISQAYRIIFRDSPLLLQVRLAEDYLLISLFLITLVLRGNFKINNLIPFFIMFVYVSFNYLAVVSDFDIVRRFLIFMLWYIILINTISKIKIEHLFYIVCFVGISAFGFMLVNIEGTIAKYVIESRRLHAEGEGMGININTINLILVSLAATATVLKRNCQNVKYGNFLITSLYIGVLIIILIGGTRSALLFYLFLILYNLFVAFGRLVILPLVIITLLSLSSLFLYIEDLVIFARIVDFDPTSSGRILAMNDSLKNFSNYPMFGVGELYQQEIQLRRIGDPDHNFYTRLLGSNGLIGFAFIMFFLIGLIKSNAKHIKGLFILQGFFLFTFFFAPAGDGAILVAAVTYYLSNLKYATS